jgi:hypothetical protein
MKRVALAALAALFAAGCQTYDFEPVVPLAVAQTTQPYKVVARQLRPNMMLLVDKSGSMESPIDLTDPRCPSGCGSGTACPATCPTRIGDLRNAMAAFLSQSATDARMGLTFYPVDNACSAPSTSDVDLPAPTPNDQDSDAVLSANASAINQRIQAVKPLGGTPTAASLAYVGSLPGLLDTGDSRLDFILLLTDGLPNCNMTNPNQVCACDPNICGTCSGSPCAAQQARCRCTLTSCLTLCQIGCLDADSVVSVTQANKAKGIKTIVVGFGKDTASGDAPEVLQAIAEAGDFPRTCRNGTDAECGPGNTCDAATKRCSKAFYQATDANGLSQVLRDIIKNITGDPCEFVLTSQPTRPEYIAVIVDGKNVASGPETWTYAGTKVTFTGKVCQDIQASTTVNPLSIEIRIVETF